MPRDTGGTYTLPGGVFVPSTVIQSNVMNSKFLDLTNAMTDSLSRSGDGGMLVPLKVPDGSATFPTFTWTSDAGTGFYLAASGTFRAVILAATVQEWSNTAVSINKPLTATSTLGVTGAATLSGGLTVTNSTTNGVAGTFTGNGTGAGLTVTGGAGGANGGNFTATASGSGVMGTGGPTNGPGVRGVGGTGGVGGSFTGTGNHGATFASSGSGAGFVATGAAGNPGGYIRAGTAPTASTPQYGLYCDVGYISLDSPAGASQTTPNSNVALKNTITPANITKAWAKVTTGTTCTLHDGINISSTTPPVVTSSRLVVTFAQAFSTADYEVTVTGTTSEFYYVVSQTTSAVTIEVAFPDYSASTTTVLNLNGIGPNSGTRTIHVDCKGRQ